MLGQVNYQYFLVEIHKQEQEKKRSSIQAQERPWLGLNGYYKDGAVIVTGAADGSPAQAAGFNAGDKIYEVDGHHLKSFEQLIEYVWTKLPGYELQFRYSSTLEAQSLQARYKDVTLGSKTPALFRSESYVDMRFNLQWGTIRQIGKKARAEFPVAEEGDILIFNHKVEYKDREVGDSTYHDYHLAHRLDNGNELRVVDYSYECYGVIKKETGGQIFPYKNVIFCHQNIRKAEILQKDGIYLPDQWKKDIEELESDIEELQLQIDSISESTVFKANTNDENYKVKEEFYSHIRELQKRKGAIAQKMNEAELMELTVLFINPKTCESLGRPIKAGDTILANYLTLYPLDIGGVYYTLSHVNYTDLLIEQNTKTMFALHNKLVVEPDPPKTVSDGGIIVPDTALRRSEKGTAVVCGPGSPDYPMLVQPGHRVRYGEKAGITFEHEGKKLVLLSVTDIIIFGFEEKEEAPAA